MPGQAVPVGAAKAPSSFEKDPVGGLSNGLSEITTCALIFDNVDIEVHAVGMCPRLIRETLKMCSFPEGDGAAVTPFTKSLGH